MSEEEKWKAQLTVLSAIIEQTPTGKPISKKRIKATISRLKSNIFLAGVTPNTATQTLKGDDK